MQARAVIQVGDGRVVELGHGDLVGRLRVCRLTFDDPRISEAHAMVSLRGDTLRLLSLRGRFTVDGVAQAEVVLQPGQRLAFAPEPGGDATTAATTACDVLEVVLPDAVLGLEGPGVPLQVLLGTTSIITAPVPTLRSGVIADAAGWLSFADDGWHLLRRGDLASTTVIPDVAIDVDGLRLMPRLVSLTDAGAPPTHVEIKNWALRLVARFHSVHIHHGDDARPLTLDGVAARIISELVQLDGPTGWEIVAREIWPDGSAEPVLRGRWDAQLSRLRSRLRQAGIRPDLVRSDRHGFVELVVGAGDTVVDET